MIESGDRVCYDYYVKKYKGGCSMSILEKREIETLVLLEKTGESLRRLKAELHGYCEENEVVKGSTIIGIYDRIEEQQRKFYRLDSELTELEKAY